MNASGKNSPQKDPSSDMTESHTHTPQRDEVADSEQESRSLHQMKRFWATIAALIALLFVMINTSPGGAESLTQKILSRFTEVGSMTTDSEEGPFESPMQDGTFTLSNFDHHPDLLYQPYMSGPILGERDESSQMGLAQQFREFLEVYVKRQAVDDNFTIRIVDGRTNEVLEIYELEEAREEYEQMEGQAGFDYWMNTIDPKRQVQTRRLVDKYVQQGIPRDPILVKWGRATQVKEALERSRPYLEYQVRLARYLGLSLLATQISTVETFNQDKLESSVGARSRFQMMPYLLNKEGINQYRLQTETDNTILVREEWNPLLVIEPAYKLAKGYANAVGHNIPGISAYHTGPNNIYKVYRYFMTQAPKWFDESNSTVMDAYMWATATNEGYQTVSNNTSFGPFSRGYVASAYGALKAMEDVPIDTSSTVRTVRVQLQPGASIYLADLLNALDGQQRAAAGEDAAPAVNTGTEESPSNGMAQTDLYGRFRELNPHIPLPAAPDTSGVPPRGNIRLVSSVDGDDVRFFLPLGSVQKLNQAGLNVIDQDKVFRFDHNTYANPEGGRTVWDERYDMLLQDIRHFGFTNENRQQLYALADHFEELAQENPSPYRRDQLDVIQTHRRIWSTKQWEQMRNATQAAFGERRAPSRPPSVLDSVTSPPQLPS